MQFLSSINWVEFIGLFMMLAGFVIGLGAVTVIDIHGFLGRKSAYWTEATTRTHKVTKPLIWAGIVLLILGSLVVYSDNLNFLFIQVIIAVILILNGLFLSFKVSPFLLEREWQGRSRDLLPKDWQNKIMAGLIVSDIGWWGSLIMLVAYLVNI